MYSFNLLFLTLFGSKSLLVSTKYTLLESESITLRVSLLSVRVSTK